jgi:glutamine amidotransferase
MSEPEVVVINYGMGNLLSVQRGFEHIGAKVTITADPKHILSAERVILPGVGAFANAMHALNQLSLIETIREVAERKIPLLGICLGMQLLFDESEEFGLSQGLRLIPGKVVPISKFSINGRPQKVPHIGWSALQTPAHLGGWGGSFLEDIKFGDAVYFVHSYMVSPEDSKDVFAECEFNGHLVPAAIARGHIMGCQFHPEKSGEVGLKILRRFLML